MNLLGIDEFAATYHTPSYEHPIDALHDYQRVIEYAANHPQKGSSAIANALDLPRGRIRPWLEHNARPDVVRGIQTAEEKAWLPLTTDSNASIPLLQLVAWIFSGGSILTASDQSISATFSVETPVQESHFEEIANELDIDYNLVHAASEDRATEARISTHGSVIARLLLALDAPTGSKSDQQLHLPGYLSAVPDEHRQAFAEIYLLNRGQIPQGRHAICVIEKRNHDYLEELGAFFRTVVDGEVYVQQNQVYLPGPTAAEFDAITTTLSER